MLSSRPPRTLLWGVARPLIGWAVWRVRRACHWSTSLSVLTQPLLDDSFSSDIWVDSFMTCCFLLFLVNAMISLTDWKPQFKLWVCFPGFLTDNRTILGRRGLLIGGCGWEACAERQVTFWCFNGVGLFLPVDTSSILGGRNLLVVDCRWEAGAGWQVNFWCFNGVGLFFQQIWEITRQIMQGSSLGKKGKWCNIFFARPVRRRGPTLSTDRTLRPRKERNEAHCLSTSYLLTRYLNKMKKGSQYLRSLEG